MNKKAKKLMEYLHENNFVSGNVNYWKFEKACLTFMAQLENIPDGESIFNKEMDAYPMDDKI